MKLSFVIKSKRTKISASCVGSDFRPKCRSVANRNVLQAAIQLRVFVRKQAIMSNDFRRLTVEYPANYQDKRMLDVKCCCPYSMLDSANKLIKKNTLPDIVTWKLFYRSIVKYDLTWRRYKVSVEQIAWFGLKFWESVM